MLTDREIYKHKALEVCKIVFEREYFGSLGIPLPLIDFIEPDSTKYTSGEYFITIGDSWQIHLNFGVLPKSYKEFSDEVRALARHEIEHYMTCPYDVITHLRMLTAIVRLYNEEFSHHNISIDVLAPRLSNEAADIIIDTHNYRRYPEETLKSEINWISKTTDGKFNELPRHAKLMSLTKQALWNCNLELGETEEELQHIVTNLAATFEKGGLINRNLFVQKVQRYVEIFFLLYQQDKQSTSDNKEPAQGQPSGQNSSPPQGEPTSLPRKDSQEENSSFIFQISENVKYALEQFAQETTISEFEQILAMAGIHELSSTEKRKFWFEAQFVDEIPISEKLPMGSPDDYTYPVGWKFGDPVEELDLMLSYAVAPILIPGVTTKKWTKSSTFSQGAEMREPDLLLLVDGSGSMGNLDDPSSKMYHAVLSSFGILKYFEGKGAEVALINFATSATLISWTKSYDTIKESLLKDGNGGTVFPIKELKALLQFKRTQSVIVIITDGEISNAQLAYEFLMDQLLLGNKLFMFLQDTKGTTEKFKPLESFGAVISKAQTSDEIRSIVLSSL